MNIAIIGFGNVGQGLVEIIARKKAKLQNQYQIDLTITAVVTRSRGSLFNPAGLDPHVLLAAIRAGHLDQYPEQAGLVRNPPIEEIVTSLAVDTVVEASPTNLDTAQPALDICRLALDHGKHLVLANKGPVALAFGELSDKARKVGVHFLYEGTVMGGTPSIRTAQTSLAGCEILEARGILNGTTNYILTQMGNGMSFTDALTQAQSLGFAETDPTADVDGWDAAGKVMILSVALFGKQLTLDQMNVQGIRHLTPEDIEDAHANGERWKLIARVTSEEGSVTLQKVPVTHPLAGVTGATNAITYTTDLLGEVTLIGAGAGSIETGFALFSDLLNISRHPRLKIS